MIWRTLIVAFGFLEVIRANINVEDLIGNLDENHKYEIQSYDGWYNNLGTPDKGVTESTLGRLARPVYEDGVYSPSGQSRPNPLLISENIFKQKTNLTEPLGKRKSKTGKNVLLVFFGQHVAEEIANSRKPACPPEYIDIAIPEKHPYRKTTGHTKMPYIRSKYHHTTGSAPNNPRQQLNDVTPWIDAGFVYGTSKGITDLLREYEGGRLKTSKNGLLPTLNDIRLPLYNPPPPSEDKSLPVSRLYLTGNEMSNETPFLLAISTIWIRWHNLLAQEIKVKNPQWNDERIFNEARKWVIATQQHVIVDEWLPQWIGFELSPYTVYKSKLDPSVSSLFQAAAVRFRDTLVPSYIYTRKRPVNVPEDCDKYEALRLCNSFWEPKLMESSEDDKVETIILGMMSQAAEMEDNMIIDDLRESFYGPLEFSRQDLMAINVERGRDFGLPDYLSVRKQVGIESNFTKLDDLLKIWPKVKKDPKILESIKSTYGDVSEIDILVGGLLEISEQGYPGELFLGAFIEQFMRIRDSDRFWFENIGNGLFKADEIGRIKKLTFGDILQAVTKLNSTTMQTNVFKLPTSLNTSAKADKLLCSQGYAFYDCSGTSCFTLPDVPQTKWKECKVPHSYDYMAGSEVSFVLTFLFLGLFIIGCVAALLYLSKRRENYSKAQQNQLKRRKRKSMDDSSVIASEWIGRRRDNFRQIILKFDRQKNVITVSIMSGQCVRMIDLSRITTLEIHVSYGTGGKHFLLIRVSREYDLVLKFDSQTDCDVFITRLEDYLGKIGVGRQRREVNTNLLLAGAFTKAHRQRELEQFFRVVFAQAFSIEHDQEEMLKLDTDQAKHIIETELTKHEFAEALSMKPTSTFIHQMFTLVDKDENGYISFREFLDMITIFSKGSADEKAKLMFDMYDIDRTGKMTRLDFSNMLRSMLELANQTLKTEEMEQLINSMFSQAGLDEKPSITLEDFMKLLADHKEDLGYAKLNFNVSGVDIPKDHSLKRRQSAVTRAKQTIVRALSKPDGDEVQSTTGNKAILESRLSNFDGSHLRVETKAEKYVSDPRLKRWYGLIRLIENYRLHIFWLIIYTLILLGIFFDRAIYYALGTEHSGFRKIAGYGVAVTRGSAASMMFSYSFILLTMCRNIITILRETFLQRYIPFDAAITFHKYIAFWGLFFTVVHTIGHAINFYHVSTQTADDITCLFRNIHHSSDELPKFTYWAFQTVTGLTGIFLVMIMSVIYVFALQYSRRHVFNAFWLTHNLYPVLYILMILHGSAALIQSPIFHYFFLGPCILFTLDRLVSVSRKRVEISVVKAELLPSDVTHLEFKRPQNFEYKSGQWVRIACPVLNSNEYHPFTLSSAPNEETLSLHIRSVGPWTRNLRKTYDPNSLREHAYPKIYLDGPFGEGHQDWYRYDVSVLVGGGIGVTPFSSILKDIVFRSSVNARFQCKKVYFIWVTRTEKHFEWLTDIIREIEENDKVHMVSVHIFITQFYQKFDLRTTMLYICERHFQKISNRSLFTGLKSITHFGRPNFCTFLDSLQHEHPDVQKIGVFSCGPPLMTRSVESACEDLNKRDEGAVFLHHYENF